MKEKYNTATIGGRIRSVRQKSKLTQQGFAASIGASANYVSELESGKRNPSKPLLLAIEYRYATNVEWLLTGEGEMHVKESAPKSSELQSQTEHATDIYAYLPLYDMSASAGGGFCATDQEEVKTLLAFKKDWIHTELLANPEELFLVHVEGESMTPVLNPGDVILVKKQDGLSIKDGIYVVRLEDVVLVKRVQRLPGNRIEISSDNQAYKPFTIDLSQMDNFAVIGRVVWAGRRF